VSDSVYLTSAGDTLDFVCWKHYRQQSGALEAVLLANHGIADLGPVLPISTRIVLPELPAVATEAAPLRLWD
jgi:phage tail protein X